MDKEYEKKLLTNELNKFRTKKYSELYKELDKTINYQLIISPNEKYQIEIQIFYDDKKTKNIRVLGSIDDGTFSQTIKPVNDDFIISPNNTFIGE
jgi:hypothetical protein